MVGPDRLSVPAARAAVDLDPWVGRLVGLDGVEREPVVACSGGPDSVALLALIVASGRTPTAVHVDHGLRPDGSAEGAFVADTAARLGARARAVRVTVVPGPNLEARARVARYRALDEVRVDLRAATVLVGHTADDQAETVVLNLLRGSAAAGLGAMAIRRDTVVRPLLGLRRSDCEAVCAAVGVTPRRDPMNDDPAFRRVAVRHDVLPRLSALAGRDLVPVLARQAAVLRSESDYLDELARAAWPHTSGPDPLVENPLVENPPFENPPFENPLVENPPDVNRADVLARLPIPLARRAVRQWIGAPPPSFADVERVLAVARGDARATEISGGHRVSRRNGRLHLVRGSVRR